MTSSFRGRLLVATPPLADPNFDRTVVLLLEHGEEGALGIVLNRPTATTVGDALPDWQPFVTQPAVVFAGGPVAPDAVIALARAPRQPVAGWVPVLDDLGTIDLGVTPDARAEPLAFDGLRVFVGYAGWGPAQLDAEIEQAAWFVVPATASDPFASEPSSLWRDVLRRQRGRLRMFATCPPDTSVN